MQLIECVPNFSEGNDLNIIKQITDAIESVEGVRLLNVDPGKATNRTVVTFVGEPKAVVQAAFKAIKKAGELIDMSKHTGEHPRMGATDVCPLIPIANITMEETVEYAHELGFDGVRITGAEAFPEAERIIKARVAEGLMDGLPWFTAERADVSCHPDALLPSARSIIALATCYLSEQPSEDEAGGPRGRISRYAWGDDYHDLIKPKLRQFAAWLQEYARHEVPELETRLFVDTGRMVDRAVARRAPPT